MNPRHAEICSELRNTPTCRMHPQNGTPNVSRKFESCKGGLLVISRIRERSVKSSILRFKTWDKLHWAYTSVWQRDMMLKMQYGLFEKCRFSPRSQIQRVWGISQFDKTSIQGTLRCVLSLESSSHEEYVKHVGLFSVVWRFETMKVGLLAICHIRDWSVKSLLLDSIT